MTATTQRTTAQIAKPSLLVIAWAVLLLISNLPNILLHELTGTIPAWLLWAKLGLLAALIVLSFAWGSVQPLRRFFAIAAVLYAAEFLVGELATTPAWRDALGGAGASFSGQMLDTQLQRLIVTAIMIVALLLLIGRPSRFFLAVGKLDAPAAPVRWLGMDRPISWSRFAPILAACISLGVLAFMILAGSFSLDHLPGVVPLLPAVLLFAAINAFSEELSYRAALLAPLQTAVSVPQALLLTAAWFGLAHYFGVPYGVVGVVMSAGLGWLLGKCMVETHGFLWAWFIHFCLDALIFAFLALGFVTPGGA